MTAMKRIESGRAGDSYWRIDHPSGLRIMVYPKENCHSAYAVFGAHFGSADETFRRTDTGELFSCPLGTAHFLEHKLFENEECDAFERFAKTGASSNAYTSFEKTCYLFSATDHIDESLEILLDFVQSPYFTEETIRKEQGIIGQEIRMYEDEPQWRVMFNLLRGMYHYHPIRNDISGTVESIAQITPKVLYDCYKTFYHLGNMVLCAAGNVSPGQVLQMADKMLKPAASVPFERVLEPEPPQVVQARVEEKMSVSFPIFELGFKEIYDCPLTEKDIAAKEILIDVISSDTSPLFRSLLDDGLINDSSFDCEFFSGNGYAAVIFSGESSDPDLVAERIHREIDRIRREGIPEEDFLRSKKSVYGRNIASLNNAEGLANAMADLEFGGYEIFRYIDAIAEATYEDAAGALADSFLRERSTLSIIKPKETK